MVSRYCSVVFALLCSIPSIADDVLNQTYLDQGVIVASYAEMQIKHTIVLLVDHLDQYEKTIANGRKNYKPTKDQQANVDKFIEVIHVLKMELGKRWRMPIVEVAALEKWKVGEISQLKTAAMPDILKPGNVMIDRKTDKPVILYDTEPAEVEVMQVIGERSFLAKFGKSIFVVENWNTSSLADGNRTTLNTWGEVKGTTSYTTPLGTTNTVFVVSVTPKADVEAAIKYCEANKTKDIRYYRRTWTDVSGKFSVEAEILNMTPKGAALKKDNGDTITIERGKLSAKDREWLKIERF